MPQPITPREDALIRAIYRLLSALEHGTQTTAELDAVCAALAPYATTEQKP